MLSAALAFKVIPLMPGVGLLDTFYFAVVTVSTVGYGDISPETPAAKLFMMLYTFGGVVLLSITVAFRSAKRMRQLERVKQVEPPRGVRSLFTHATNVTATSSVSPSQQRRSLGAGDAAGRAGTTTRSGFAERLGFWHWIDKWMQRKPVAMRVVLACVPLLLFLVLGAVTFGVLEKWPLIDAAYFTFTTGTTIGFGDLSPTTASSKLVAIVFIPLCVYVITLFMDAISNIFVQREMERLQQQILSTAMDDADLFTMDGNKDGHVDELEFTRHMLLKMKKVDKETLDTIHNHFLRADVDGNGVLDEDDVRLLRRRTSAKRRSVVRG